MITDGIIKYSMQKHSIDNVSVIFIAFKNFEDKMKDPDFEYKAFAKTSYIKDKIDFSIKTKQVVILQIKIKYYFINLKISH